MRRRKLTAYSHPRKLSQEVVDMILNLRCTYKLGPGRIKWYFERYHWIKISESSVYRTLVPNNISRLPKTAHR